MLVLIPDSWKRFLSTAYLVLPVDSNQQNRLNEEIKTTQNEKSSLINDQHFLCTVLMHVLKSAREKITVFQLLIVYH